MIMIDTYSCARVRHQFRRVQVVAVEGGATRVSISARTGAQWLREVQPHVNGVADLLNRALRQQVDVLIVRIVVILGGLGQRGACAFGKSHTRLQRNKIMKF